MRDIPVFTVPSGIATLILREIPPRGEAYVLLRGVFTSQEELLTEILAVLKEQQAANGK